MIPAEAIAHVKARHDLVGFIESCGIALKRHGESYLGLCRFHEDRRPSLSVDPAKQYWCCLGACSAPGKVVGGDVIEFARRYWGVGFREALARLGGATTMALPAPLRAPLRVVGGRKAVRPPVPADLLGQVVTVYHQAFLASAEAKEYAASRGLTNPDLLTALPIGYADGSLLERAPEGSETHAGLKALGVLTAGGRELLAGCLVVPLRDLSGAVVSLYGRKIEGDGHLYLPGPRRGLVNAAAGATCDELILAESVLDALSFLQAGIPNAVPLYGTNGWTP
ncbi:MAG: CHC2 zinc finger domain-containing protein, partial [Actinomycetes bacterium]